MLKLRIIPLTLSLLGCASSPILMDTPQSPPNPIPTSSPLAQSTPVSEIMTAEQWYAQANTAYAQGDWDLAIQYFSQAITIQSDYADAYFYRGEVYYVLGDYYSVNRLLTG